MEDGREEEEREEEEEQGRKKRRKRGRGGRREEEEEEGRSFYLVYPVNRNNREFLVESGRGGSGWRGWWWGR